MPTILVADDNSNIQKMVSLVFQEKGIRVVAVGNGEAACRKVPEVRPDVVLADVFMPVRNGYEVCEFVKQDPQFAETPVVLLVGAFDPLDEKEAQRVGANGVLKKPFVPPEPLIAMVNSLLGKTEVPVEEPPPAQEAVKIELPPPPEPAPRRAPQEFAFGSSDENDEAVSTFGSPVATPAAKTSDTVEDNYPEEESEWTKRRATVDYQIDTADSADLVEKLAAEGMADETEIHATNKHLPFGGANVPEAIPEILPKPHPSEWLRSKAQETAVELPTENVEPLMLTEEAGTPVHEERTAPDSSDAQNEPEFDSMDQTQIASPPIVPYIAPAQEPVPESLNILSEDPARAADAPANHADDTMSEPPPAPWPMPLHTPPSYPESTSSSTEKGASQPPLQETTEKISEPAFILPETTVYGGSNDGDSVASEADESIPSTTTGKVDQATVDDVVAKVISKLEPQLHEALANGVLRPLVEELLNKQRDKK